MTSIRGKDLELLLLFVEDEEFVLIVADALDENTALLLLDYNIPRRQVVCLLTKIDNPAVNAIKV